MDEIPDCANVIIQLFREGQGSANEPPNLLMKRIVDPLHMGCLATLFADRTMALGWKHANIGFPEVAITTAHWR